MRAAAMLIALVALGMASGCGQSRIPEASRLTTDPGELSRLDRGRSLYLTRCGGCHALYEPAALLPAAWPDAVAVMRKRSQVSVEEQGFITHYLVTASGAVGR